MINKKKGELIVLLFVTRMEFLCIVKEKHS